MINTRLVSIEGEPSFAKDEFSQALINTDVNMLKEYKARKEKDKMLKDLREEVNLLRSELEKIKFHLGIS